MKTLFMSKDTKEQNRMGEWDIFITYNKYQYSSDQYKNGQKIDTEISIDIKRK